MILVDLRERFDRTKPQSGPFVRLEDIKGDLELSIQLVANGLSAADVGSGSTAVRPWGLGVGKCPYKLFCRIACFRMVSQATAL